MVLWAFAVLLAYFVKGLTGFGNTLVVTSMMAYTMDNAAITPVELLLTSPANLIMAWRYRRHADLRTWLPLALMVVVGGIPGMLLLKNLDTHLIKILFGFFVIYMGVDMLISRQGNKQLPKAVDFLVCLAAGVMCGLFGVGAMLGAYLGRTMTDTKSYKANLSMVFSLENITRTILYAVSGLLTLETLKRFTILLPFMGLGLFLGMKSSTLISDQAVRKAVIIMLIISGAALIVTNLL